MRSVFLGTPAASVPSLAALMDVTDVELVVTRPDTAQGRSGKPVPPAVKTAAAEWGIPVAQPAGRSELDAVIASSGADICVVVAYGRIISPAALDVPPYGFVNVHFSLLPRWRGAAPVERAILAGDAVTGVTLMQLDEGMDTGPVIAAIETPIGPDETGGSLTGRLSYLGAMLIDDALPDLLARNLEPAAQLSAGMTMAPRLDKKEARIEPTWDAGYAERAIRAFTPRPGAWFVVDGTNVRVHRARQIEGELEPGTLEAVGSEPVLGLDGGCLLLETVQPAGKAPMPGTAWMNGRRGRGGRIEPADA